MIRKTAEKKYTLISKGTGKVLGHHTSRASAVRQEVAIMLAKKRAARGAK